MLEGKKINELSSISTISDETVIPAVYVNNGSANSEASKVSIDQIKAHINEDNYTKNQVDILLNTKQDKLTAGAGIEIESDEISIDDTVLTKTKLVAGSNVTIAEDSDENLVISSTGGSNDGANKNLSNLTDAGKIVAGNMSMPSATYDDLTPGTSGDEYTAPADGYFVVGARYDTSHSGFIRLVKENLYSVTGFIYNDGALASIMMPVHKGEKVKYNYAHVDTQEYFKFFYAVGSESEYTPAE